MKATAERLSRYRIRTCRWMHACALCAETISDGQRYYDGGLDKRAHVQCVLDALGEWCPPDMRKDARR